MKKSINGHALIINGEIVVERCRKEEPKISAI